MDARRASLCLVVMLALAAAAPGCSGDGPTGTDDAGGGEDSGRDAGGIDARPTDDGGGCTPDVETCDGEDQDCDGRVDESVTVACGTDVGACVAGTAACVDGAPGECEGAIEASDEVCNGIDDSCDGTVDEGCPCSEGETQPCGTDTGECAAGTQACTAGAWGDCTGEVEGSAETCNGLDDNCDGIVDDGFSVGVGCDGSDADGCEEGTTACSADGSGVVCDDAADDDAEVCDGTGDEDCDLAVDEGCACTDGMTRPCGSATGECSEGTQTCAGGAWGACAGGIVAVPELCNGLDDDCDGTADDGFVLGGGCDGADTDACEEGAIVCAPGGAGTTCDDATGDSVEACNNLDDDCDGAIDDGFGTLACGTGACARTTPACSGGVTQTCTPGTPGTETCNGADDDCDGTADDGLGTLSCGVGRCFRMVPACTGGTPGSCTPGPMMPEACNSLDDDCDGTSDESLGTISCGIGACMPTIPACVGGAPQTCTPLPGTIESCNGADDDCDGMVDEGNPGGGVACGGAADVGGCTARTVCRGGLLECIGTFVGPAGVGSASAPGTRAMPLSTIGAAIANAVTIGGGADVCVCDTAAAGASIYGEDVTMVEGVSVLGGYDCTAWSRMAGRTTSIDEPDADGLVFPAGVTSITRLEEMTVIGRTAAGMSTTAITINGSAPTLDTVTVDAGDGPTTRGIECASCNATLTSVTVLGGTGATSAVGLRVTGPVAMLSVVGGSYNGGMTTGAGSTSAGVQLEGCTGAPALTGVSTFGGATPSSSTAVGTRTGIDAIGSACAPRITGGRHRGCEGSSATCVGISCSAGARCDVANVTAMAPATWGIVGATSAVPATYGIRCQTGGCGTIRGSAIWAGAIGATSTVGIGVELDASSPIVDDDLILAPDGRPGTAPAGRFYALYLRGSAATVTNNVMLDSDFNGEIDVVRLDATAVAPGIGQPTLHSNTIQYENCSGCGDRFGLAIGGAGPATGVIRNNLIEHAGSGNTGGTRPVIERGAMCDFSIFENNALYDPNYPISNNYYVDEGGTGITVGTLNGYPMHSGNLGTNCNPTATWHIAMSSACHNAGTATGAPRTDFDGEARPRSGTMPDIGADEFYP